MKTAYFHLMKDDGAAIAEAAPGHHRYWRGLALEGYSGGPFADRSGGMIVFEAASLEEARTLVAADPFLAAGVLESHWVKEWAAR